MQANFQNSSDTCNLYGRLEDRESAVKWVETKQAFYKKNKVCDRPVMLILIVALIILNVILVGLVSTAISRSDQELHFDSVAEEYEEYLEELETRHSNETKQLKLEIAKLEDSKDLNRIISGDSLSKKIDNVMAQLLLKSTQEIANITINVSESVKKEIRQMKKTYLMLSGWGQFENLLYKCFDDVVTYKTADTTCRKLGGRLAAKILRSRAAIRDLKALKCYGWVGLNDLETEGTWQWVDGGTMNHTTTEWAPNQPDNYQHIEDCARLRTFSINNTIVLNDISCSNRRKFICERNIF